MSDKEIIYIPLCQISELPKNGWIHACFLCELYTSRSLIYKQTETEDTITVYQIILCPPCQKQCKLKPHILYKIYKSIREQYNIER